MSKSDAVKSQASPASWHQTKHLASASSSAVWMATCLHELCYTGSVSVFSRRCYQVGNG